MTYVVDHADMGERPHVEHKTFPRVTGSRLAGCTPVSLYVPAGYVWHGLRNPLAARIMQEIRARNGL